MEKASEAVLCRIHMIAVSIGITLSGCLSSVSTWNDTMEGVETNPMNAVSEYEPLMVLFCSGAAVIGFFLYGAGY